MTRFKILSTTKRHSDVDSHAADLQDYFPAATRCNGLRTGGGGPCLTASLNTRYTAGGINFVDGQAYWIADANGPKPHDRGIFRCAPADIPYPEKHTLLFNPEYECANMIIQDGVILAAHYATASPYNTGIIISLDMGKTWAQYDLKEFGKRSPVRFHEKNSEGWFRVDLRSGWVQQAEVLFLKPIGA